MTRLHLDARFLILPANSRNYTRLRAMPRSSASRNCRICSLLGLCFIYRLCLARTSHTICQSCVRSCKTQACNALRLLNPYFCMSRIRRISRYAILALLQYLNALRLIRTILFGRTMGCMRSPTALGLHRNRFVDMSYFVQAGRLLGRRESFTSLPIRQHLQSTVRPQTLEAAAPRCRLRQCRPGKRLSLIHI